MYIHYQIIQNFILKTVYYAHFIFLNKFVVNPPCILPALLHNPPPLPSTFTLHVYLLSPLHTLPSKSFKNAPTRYMKHDAVNWVPYV